MKPTRKPFPKEAFIDIAIDHGLSSPDTADKIYRKVLNKMKKELEKQGINSREASTCKKVKNVI